MLKNLPRKKTIRPTNRLKAFTLIEMLLVVVIISILSGVVIAVINPVTARQRANESVMAANISKMCQALIACISSQGSYNTGRCKTPAQFGVSVPTDPAGATYYIFPSSTSTTSADSWVGIRGSMPVQNATASCNMSCLVRNDTANWNGGLPGTVFENLSINPTTGEPWPSPSSRCLPN